MHNEWTLEQWLHSFEQRNTQEIQLGLARIKQVAERLSLFDLGCIVLTVTGTNGKGSTVAALERIYHLAGYSVGTYTSPHLLRFNERIRINQNPLSDTAICDAFEAIEAVRQDTVLTYFEMATLAALWLFKRQALDVVILEVGIGGRLDATNIIDADLSIITTVDFDHQEYLGSTLDAIGYEKAGILREGKPFIYADTTIPDSILKVAEGLNAPAHLFGHDFFYQEGEDHWQLTWYEQQWQLNKPLIQLKSASAATIATQILKERLPVTSHTVNEAMKNLAVAGRLQLVEGPISVLFDVSHNAQSANLLAAHLKKLKAFRRVHAVFAALKDKDILNLIKPLKDCVDHWYPAQLDTKRATTSEELLAKFHDEEIFMDICYTSPSVAFETALNRAQTGDLIVVYGSFYTVGQVMTTQHNLFE